MTNKFGGRTDNTENFKKNFEKKNSNFFFSNFFMPVLNLTNLELKLDIGKVDIAMRILLIYIYIFVF